MTARTSKIGKGTALALGGLLVLSLTGVALAGAGATVNDVMPFVRGNSAAGEGALARGDVALAVHVDSVNGSGNATPLAGVPVTVTAFHCARHAASSNATHPACQPGRAINATTDADGAAVLELHPGAYRIAVAAGDGGSLALRMATDTRATALVGPDGSLHWILQHRSGVLRNGSSAPLLVGVGERANGTSIHRLANATVEIYHAERGSDGVTAGALVANATTGPRGAAVLSLPRGAYVVEVRSGAFSAERPILHARGQGLAVVFNDTGGATWHVLGRAGADHLGVRVVRGANRSTLEPVANATVSAYRMGPDNASASGDPVATATTGPHGIAVLKLPPGRFEVTANAGNLSGSHLVVVHGFLTRLRLALS